MREGWGKFLVRFALAAVVMAAAGCVEKPSADDPILQKPAGQLTDADLARILAEVQTSEGAFTIRLRPDWAPQTCRHFLGLAKMGFYRKLTFHEVLPGIWIKGGDPRGDGKGGKQDNLPWEQAKTPDGAGHLKGRVGLYHHEPEVNQAWSQFFIMLSDRQDLNGTYRIFGEVVSGMAAVERIGRVPTEKKDGLIASPVKPVIITDMRLLAVKAK